MSTLKIFDEAGTQNGETINEHDAISSTLHNIGVRFEQWQANQPLSADSSNEDIMAAYQQSVDALMKEYDFQSADVIALTPDHPDKAALRQKFMDEHTHSDFEVRFFVEGQGLFFIHHEDSVYAIMCERGDLISVPANAKHWFDMGENPNFKCIRLFTTPEGWMANYTGDKIAERLPKFEQY